MRTKKPLLCLMLITFLILYGCAADPRQPIAEPASDPVERPVLSLTPATEPEMMTVAVSLLKGGGRITYDLEEDSEPLGTEQEKLLLDYMDLYYQSLADLSANDPSPLFSEGAKNQALTRQSVWQVVIEVRSAQKVDLSLTAFSYELRCTGIREGEDGGLSITAREDATQIFAAFPGVDSQTFNLYHRFTIEETSSGWKLRSHNQMDSANMVALGRAAFGGFRSGEEQDSDETDYGAELAAQRERVLSAHTAEIAEREREFAAYDPDAPPAKNPLHGYDREAAVTYAMEWAGVRNEALWPTYDRYGGNCANFTSQCLLAGGIPMDYFGYNQWKWYGDTPSTAQAAVGRSGAWSGVDEFYTYVTENEGFGMVTDPDANFWSGEPGDLIQLGYEGDWRHVVIITEVICDDDGNPTDYLINSNTADQRNYPVSAYLYPMKRLIKIYGWNEG